MKIVIPQSLLYILIAGTLLASGCATRQQPTKTAPLQPLPAVATAPTETTAPQQLPASPAAAAENADNAPFRNKPQPAPMIDQADRLFIDQRLDQYENQINQLMATAGLQHFAGPDPERDQCLEQLEYLRTEYRQLLEWLNRAEILGAGNLPALDPRPVYRRDIAYQDSNCRAILLPSAGTEASAPEADQTDPFLRAAREQEMTLFHQAYSAGKFADAVAAYQRFTELDGDRDTTTETRLAYARALMAVGQAGLAAEQYRQILAPTMQFPQPWSDRRLLADLLLVSGDAAAATEQYRLLAEAHDSMFQESTWAMAQLDFLQQAAIDSPEFQDYRGILNAFLVYDYKLHGNELNQRITRFSQAYPNSLVLQNVLRLRQKTEEQLGSWISAQLREINDLLIAEEFNPAHERLALLNSYYLPPSLREAVQSIYDEVTMIKAEDIALQRQQQEEAQAKQWQDAMNLVDSQQFDAAIAGFTTLLNTDYDARARLKINETATIAASRNRLEAANLFNKALQTAETGHKKELLLASRRLLQDILVKYPQVEIADKVSRHLQILEEQIRRIDPALLEEPAAAESPAQLPAAEDPAAAPDPVVKTTIREENLTPANR